VRYALRTLGLNPGFTTVAVLTLGIGATTAIFISLNTVLLRPLPAPNPHELFVVYETAPEEPVADVGGAPGQLLRFSYPRFERLERSVGPDAVLAAMSRAARFTIRTPGESATTTALGQLVSGRFFEAFGVSAFSGRVLTDADAGASQPSHVAVISYRAWENRFERAPDIVGRDVLVNGVPLTIVGVAPPAFTGAWLETPIDIWLPLPMQHAIRYRGNASFHNSDGEQPWILQAGIEWLNIVGRAAPDARSRVHTQLGAANRPGLLELAEIMEDSERQERLLAHTLEVGSFARGFSALRERAGRSLVMLTALAILLLLVVCSNVANLLVARAIGRQHEIAVRMSLGASRARLIGQCLTESLVLAAVGGALGFLVAGWANALLATVVLNVSSDVLASAFVADLRVVGFAAASSLGTAAVFGLLPALRVSGVELRGALGGGAKRPATRPITGMQALVAGQLALSFVVVLCAGLFGRSLLNLSRLDPGFDRGQLLTVTVDPVASGYSPEQIPPLYARLNETVAAVPGVISSALSTCGLVSGCEDSSGHQFEGYQALPGENVRARDNFVGAGYFSTVGIQLVEGRGIDARDTSTGPPVAVVNESVVRRYFGGASPIGRRLGYGALDTEIVGVVRDARVTSLRAPAIPLVYRPLAQRDRPARVLDVRVAGDPQRLTDAVRESIRRREAQLLITRVVTMDQQLNNSITRDRGVAYLIAAFGVLALFLACVGLYGVMSFAIARRTRELGVRLAVGAAPADLVRMIVGGGLKVVGCGVAAGAVVAFAAGKLVESLLFETSPTDPFTYLLVTAALAAATLVASYLPARRAARLDPVAALRCE
jgi:predicted permease